MRVSRTWARSLQARFDTWVTGAGAVAGPGPRRLRTRAAALALALAACTAAPPEPQQARLGMLFPAPPASPSFRLERTLRGARDVLETPGAAMLYRQRDPGPGPGLAGPHALAAGHGLVFVSDPGEGRVNVFDLANRRFFSIGAAGPVALQRPLGLSVGRAAELYVADGAANTILVYDLQGRYLRGFGGPQQFAQLSAVSVDPDGQRLYAIDLGGADVHDARVQVLDARDGRALFSFGQRGSGAGELNLPSALAVGSGRLYVADAGNLRVQVYDLRGTYLGAFGSAGARPGQFGRPKAIAADAAGQLYVLDALRGNIQVFDADGALRYTLGGRGETGADWGALLPTGLALDAQGRLYCLDQGYRKIDIFSPLSQAGERHP